MENSFELTAVVISIAILGMCALGSLVLLTMMLLEIRKDKKQWK